jgi:hypothetical protein
VGVPTVDDILRARELIQTAVQFLRGGREDEIHLLEGSLSFEMGVLHTLDWILGLSGSEWFARHLTGLQLIEHQLEEKQPWK